MRVRKKDTPTTWIDPDDMPELTEEWFQKADLYHGDKLVRRGRPVGSGSKKSITIRFDEDIIAKFRAKGKFWQTAMNDALREWLKAH